MPFPLINKLLCQKLINKSKEINLKYKTISNSNKINQLSTANLT